VRWQELIVIFASGELLKVNIASCAAEHDVKKCPS